MHVTCMNPDERTKGERITMHAYVTIECVERLQANGGVPRCGRGRGRARRADADGEGTS